MFNRRKGDNNSISSSSFHWTAIFKDEKISQFDDSGEHKFQEVINKMSDLAYFNLTNRQGKLFTVDLLQGLIGFNYLALPYVEVSEKKENIRLIFFRRHTVELNENLKENKHNVVYFLGFQYTDKSGNNRKNILQIDEEGSWIFLGE
jgi:hypothetical protein